MLNHERIVVDWSDPAIRYLDTRLVLAGFKCKDLEFVQQ